MSSSCSPAHCTECPGRRAGILRRLGLKFDEWDYVAALAGNPNTGKSTVFNALTGLRQHTGNWPGKTISRAEGGFVFAEKRFKLVDLPGTYSLLSASPDEEVARDFILFGRPDVTIIVVDASQLERNLNLALQVLQITNKAVVCLNLMDEARAHKIEIDISGLSQDLGVPVVPCTARSGEGIDLLLEEVRRVVQGEIICRPFRLHYNVLGLHEAIGEISSMLVDAYPEMPHREWVALRLLEGDRRIKEALQNDDLQVLLENSNEASSSARGES